MEAEAGDLKQKADQNWKGLCSRERSGEVWIREALCMAVAQC